MHAWNWKNILDFCLSICYAKCQIGPRTLSKINLPVNVFWILQAIVKNFKLMQTFSTLHFWKTSTE